MNSKAEEMLPVVRGSVQGMGALGRGGAGQTAPKPGQSNLSRERSGWGGEGWLTEGHTSSYELFLQLHLMQGFTDARLRDIAKYLT